MRKRAKKKGIERKMLNWTILVYLVHTLLTTFKFHSRKKIKKATKVKIQLLTLTLCEGKEVSERGMFGI